VSTKEQIREIVAGLMPEQQVTFTILAVKQVYKEPNWNVWADNWLSGKNRSGDAAWRATRAGWAETRAGGAAGWAAARAARAATRAARRWRAGRRRGRRWAAATAAALAVRSALEADPALDLEAIAKQAITHTTQTQGAKQ